MMSLVPSDIRNQVRDRVWRQAREMGWIEMSLPDKATQYAHWVADPEVGGLLAKFMEPRAIRVYLKDTIVKQYVVNERRDSGLARTALRISADAEILREYQKPAGIAFTDGKVIAWGRADDWKTIVTAMHERMFGRPGFTSHGVLLTKAVPRYLHGAQRALVEDAAKKLGIGSVVWMDS
jgi:hypothetical protein